MRGLNRFLTVILLAVLALSCDLLGPKRDDADLSVTLKSELVGRASGEVGVTVRAMGSWTLDLDFVDGSEWAQLTRTYGAGYKSNIILKYTENTTGEPRKLYLILTSESGAVAECSFTQGLDFAGLDGGITETAGYAWLELPKTKDGDGLVWGWHNMNLDGKSVRNYSFYFDKNHSLSYWVAYPLNSDLMGPTGMRDGKFIYDPMLEESWQANLFRSYKGDYDRGHQCPARDRSASIKSNAQTFYATNMTPQRSAFNQQIWAKFESSVQGWARALNSATDTLYVVTGCVVDEDSWTTSDCAGKSVTVPSAYYKALLRYKNYSYDACAVWLGHNTDPYRKVDRTDMMSVAALEKKLGYELFVNLSAKLGEEKASAIKTKTPSSNAWPL